ncbi:PIG-L family deacetylase [Pseudoponticoccus marisrubri]|uniref:GlcNAc-PI de-N-acetylase n=1 Tax=Pseudoponticoccus marisrubri TaxID=1685382 RepID=A0A0W7WKM2_9RHOB|nr:PIG-L family deacetylase [Pseudoponticoccus marisrubri]KUF11164.1 hypothetical protein AVJ23_08915 [Pseudoponticoccus marisrubri]
MPELSTGGALSIVAHQDDDILFMNPDIDASIGAGEANTTVFVTAGDAGLGAAYWGGRETGAKAAYSLMTGVEDWVDELVPVEIGGRTVELASSHPEGMPEVRLYFMRLPDGGGNLAPDDQQQLARLEAGTLETVTAVDGSASYDRDELVETMTALLDLHAPNEVRLQIADGANAAGEHTDHVSATRLAEEALEDHAGESFTVTQYVQYASRDMPANLDPAEAARSLAIMEAYAEHDPGVFDSSGAMAQVYVDWTARQYIDRVVEVDPDNPWTVDDTVIDAPELPEDDGAGFALSGPDGYLFDVNGSGEITPKDWFTPSLDDAWDRNDDYIYEVTRIRIDEDGSRTEEALRFDTVAEGRLALMDGAEDDADPVEPDPVDPDPVDPVEADPVDPDPLPLSYSLDGPDAFLFTIDGTSGQIAPQDWFTPSLDDAWDADEDHVYELTRIATAEDGSRSETALSFETTAEGELTLRGEAAIDPALDPDPTPEPDPDTDPDPGDSPATYSLDGPDSLLFTIAGQTGEIGTKDWFIPSYDDAWDRNEDHVYEIARVATYEDGASTAEELRFETLPNGRFVPLTDGAGEEAAAALMSLIALPGEGDMPPEDAEEADETMDLAL